MKLTSISLFALVLTFGGGPADAHPGGLDGNGCHYSSASGRYHCHREGAPNEDIRAPVKKSRTNICHDASSPNYTQLVYFISFPSMDSCVKSGGRRTREVRRSSPE